ncbi:hypothetical protein ABM90_31330 [Rhodococcus erythropolis]|nr:hypothetical protein ABM90_31330 [Rhodococcus erythropolis]
MPPTHPSQADAAAAYRTLIAHETEPKEQDFYRTRLQRLEQATEPECEFDCRNRVAAAGVGVYCPQCSAKCADTDLATQLAKAIRAAWVDRLDWDELAHAALKFLTAAGRLVPAGGMALTAERIAELIADAPAANYEESDYNAGYVAALINLRDALFPATEPAEEVKPVHPRPNVGDWGYGGGAAVYAPEVRGKTREELLSEKVEQLQAQVKHLSRVAVNAAEHGIKAPSGSLKPCGYCHSTEATLLHACTNCGAMTSDPWSQPAPAEPAEEETKADLCAVRLCVLPAEHSGVHADREGLRWNTPSSSPVVPASTETGPWQRIEDVPETVGRLTDRDGDVWEWDGDNWVTPETAILPTAYINKHFAPFVAAKEG